jgi:hypothetical protein
MRGLWMSETKSSICLLHPSSANGRVVYSEWLAEPDEGKMWGGGHFVSEHTKQKKRKIRYHRRFAGNQGLAVEMSKICKNVSALSFFAGVLSGSSV